MFKSKNPRNGHTSPQNPVSDMEQFYLQQYFVGPMHPSPHTPYPTGNSDRFPPVDLTRIHQLELRITRIEEYLGLTTHQTSTKPFVR